MADDADKPETPEGDEGRPSTPKPETGKEPEFEGEFDADRAKRLVANLRKEKDDLASEMRALKAQVDEKGKGEKTLQERLEALEERAATAERNLLVAKVAKECKVPDDLVEFLTAKDEAGLKAQAERLASHVKPSSDDGGVTRRPRPALKPGHGGDEPPAFDPEAVAKAARRR